ncbi:MAG TPA: DEAD/DEAH box helicase [Bacteroidales bacterium]|nr:DEAD/DEAH box helicase [Bacteroidales bacterium]
MIRFDEMGLDAPLLKAVKDLGFEVPTPIQVEVIPKLLKEKKDLVALAQTGTGKTAAFGLPLIQMADAMSEDVQSLILCPTRELCIQITNDLKSFAKHKKGFSIIPVYGGASMDTQIKSLKKGGQIIVGTPGRMLDLIKKKHVKIEKIQWLVLDEADEMLNMGFKEDLDAILLKTPENKQTLLFSATMPKEISRIAARYMHQPEEISVGQKNTGAENVMHEYYVTPVKYRYEVLKRIADMNPKIYGIVFCRTRRETKEVADKFMTDGYNADALHGDLSQSQRDYVMNRFRNGNLQMLVATDVAARGLDVNDLTHVINYNLPDDLEVYIHRSGRTGRAGKSGTSISIVHTRETKKVKDLEKIIGKSFKRKAIPEGREICKKQLFNLIDKVEKVEVNDEQIEEFLPEIHKKLSWLSREELIKHFVSVEFNRFLSYYKDAPDLNLEIEGPGQKKGKRDDFRGKDKVDRGGRSSNTTFTRFFISMGKKDNLNASRLIGILNDNTRSRSIEIGKIDILRNFSFFEVDDRHEKTVRNAFSKGLEIDGKRVSVDIAAPDYPEAGGTGKKNYRKEYKSGKRKPGKRR